MEEVAIEVMEEVLVEEVTEAGEVITIVMVIEQCKQIKMMRLKLKL